MVSVSYPARFLLDYDFLKFVLTGQHKGKIVSSLLHIHNSSKENKKCQNWVLKIDLDKLISEGLIKDKDLLRGGIKAFDPASEVKKIIEEEHFDEIMQRGVLGVFLTDEPPCKVVLITTQEKINGYNEKAFFEKIKDLSIKNETEGLYLIDSFFKKFCNERDLCRI
jgi:hypothetical protein